MRYLLASLFCWLFFIASSLRGVEPNPDTIALGEGAAIGNAIDAMAQMGSSGFVVLSRGKGLDFAMDEAECPYDPAIHMPEVIAKGRPLSSLLANLNAGQSTAKFSATAIGITALIPATDDGVARLLQCLDRPLGMPAGTTCTLNDTNTFVPLEDAIRKIVQKEFPSIKSVRISVWPEGDGLFYLRTSEQPNMPPMPMDPDTTLRALLEKPLKATPGLVWIVDLSGEQLLITSTSVQIKRNQKQLSALLTSTKPSYQALEGYPTIPLRIHDSIRELRRRLILDSGPTIEALAASGIIRELVRGIAKDDANTTIHGHLYQMLGFRHPALTKLIIAEVDAAPVDIFREFYFTVLPGIDGRGPGWKELYKPIWSKLQESADKDIVRRAKLMSVERSAK